MNDPIQQEARQILDTLAFIQHLPPEAIHSLIPYLPDYVKIALMEKANQLECSLEAAIEMALASFLDEEAFSFEDCLLSQRIKDSELG